MTDGDGLPRVGDCDAEPLTVVVCVLVPDCDVEAVTLFRVAVMLVDVVAVGDTDAVAVRVVVRDSDRSGLPVCVGGGVIVAVFDPERVQDIVNDADTVVVDVTDRVAVGSAEPVFVGGGVIVGVRDPVR